MLDNLDQDLFEAFQRGPSATHPTADDVVACAAEVLTAGSYDASAVTEAGEVAALVFLRRFVRASEMGSLFPAMAAERTAFAVQAVRNSVNPCSFVRLPPQRAGMVHVGGLYVLQLLATVVDGEFFITESRMMALAALGGVAIASLDVLRRSSTARAIEIRLAPMQQFLVLHFEGSGQRTASMGSVGRASLTYVPAFFLAAGTLCEHSARAGALAQSVL